MGKVKFTDYKKIFEEKKKPVSFNEAINSRRNIRFEFSNKDFEFIETDFKPLDKIFSMLGAFLNREEILLLINEGEWFVEFSKLDIIEKCKSLKERYFLVIGKYINCPIGCCSLEGLSDTHKEEPDAKFYEISEEEFLNFENMEYEPEGKDWIAESKSYQEIMLV